MKYVAITGRSNSLSVAELESVFGHKYILPVSDQAVLVASNNIKNVAQNIGGTIKIAEVLVETRNANWNYLQSYVMKNASLLLNYLPDGKINLGISAFDIEVSPGKINAFGLTIKKLAKQYGKNIRIIPNKENSLNSAQIHHNYLLSEKGMEIILVKKRNGGCIIAQTVHEQNIDDYAKRDQNRPYRDSRIGMLPPKLAQMIVNLAKPSPGSTILDPFCGTGVLLQEAGLMGYEVYGTDIDERMIDYSNKNLSWLINDLNKAPFGRYLELADATSYEWRKKYDAIACETYLGRALTSLPDHTTLQKIINDCDIIHKKFLQNVSRQTKPGFRMCIAVPSWKTKDGFLHLKTLDHLKELGYNRISLVHVDAKSLIYHRHGQTVARELVVLERV